MGAPPGPSSGSPTEESRAQKSNRRHSETDGGGPVALADRQGQSQRAGLGDGRRQSMNQPIETLNEGKRREFETERGRTGTWVGTDQICRLGVIVCCPGT